MNDYSWTNDSTSGLHVSTVQSTQGTSLQHCVTVAEAWCNKLFKLKKVQVGRQGQLEHVLLQQGARNAVFKWQQVSLYLTNQSEKVCGLHWIITFT